MRMNIDGVEWKMCDRCESWTDKIFCNCFEKKMNENLAKIINSNRKQNNHLIMVVPYGRERSGISSCGIDMSMFAFHAVSETEDKE